MPVMAKTYYRQVVSSSFILASVIMFNIVALSSFFFIQVGSILFIVPAAIIDVFYLLNKEEIGPMQDAYKPSITIMKMVFIIISVCLVLFSALFIFEVIQAS
jgi:hypothetical protein